MPQTRQQIRYAFALVTMSAIGLAATFGIPAVDGRIMSAWAFPQGGRPPLLGVWSGVLTTGGGARMGVGLELERRKIVRDGLPQTNNREFPFGEIRGRLSLCRPDGRTVRYEVSGAADDRHAAHFFVFATPTAGSPDGLTPSWIRARWAGGDEITAQADIHRRAGASAITSSGDPDTGKVAKLDLRRAEPSALQSPCALLAR